MSKVYSNQVYSLNLVTRHVRYMLDIYIIHYYIAPIINVFVTKLFVARNNRSENTYYHLFNCMYLVSYVTNEYIKQVANIICTSYVVYRSQVTRWSKQTDRQITLFHQSIIQYGEGDSS